MNAGVAKAAIAPRAGASTVALHKSASWRPSTRDAAHCRHRSRGDHARCDVQRIEGAQRFNGVQRFKGAQRFDGAQRLDGRIVMRVIGVTGDAALSVLTSRASVQPWSREAARSLSAIRAPVNSISC